MIQAEPGQARVFTDFYEARDYAATTVKGFPAWRVTTLPGESRFGIELLPGQGLWLGVLDVPVVAYPLTGNRGSTKGVQ